MTAGHEAEAAADPRRGPAPAGGAGTAGAQGVGSRRGDEHDGSAPDGGDPSGAAGGAGGRWRGEAWRRTTARAAAVRGRVVRGGAVVVALAVMVVAVAVAVSSPDRSPGSTDGPAQPGASGGPIDEAGSAGAEEDWIARTDDDALFTVDCPFSHRAGDDPIVHPGVPGASHSHEFFGSTASDAGSTGPSLRGTATTCEDADDTAAYWVPTLSVRGVPVEPVLLRAYYRARVGVDVRDVAAPPLGLAMISGDPAATGPGAGSGAHGDDHAGTDTGAHDSHVGTGPGGAGAGTAGPDGVIDAGWGCGLRPRRLRAAPPTDCNDRALLTLQLRFPDCWDGRNLDSPDHRSHVARSVDGACPASHPVLMAELQVSVSWPVIGADGGEVSLASGAVQGAHGDFLNGWDPAALAAHVELCIHAKANCTIG